jgi:hypothetical protein
MTEASAHTATPIQLDELAGATFESISKANWYGGVLPNVAGSELALWVFAYTLAMLYPAAPKFRHYRGKDGLQRVWIEVGHTHPKLGPGTLVIEVSCSLPDKVTVRVLVRFRPAGGKLQDPTLVETANPLGFAMFGHGQLADSHTIPSDPGKAIVMARATAARLVQRLKEYYKLVAETPAS